VCKTRGALAAALDNQRIQWKRNMFGNDIRARIEKDYGASAQSVAEQLEHFIESFRKIYNHHPGNRLLRCVVHLAEGKMENMQHYLKAALADWRDVIYWAEYDRNDKRIHDFNLLF
jgi:hypothetical protein